jgi:hypothetical protein
MKRIKFMEDYGCWALWHMDYQIDGEMGNIDPHSLPIDSSLADKIDEWSKIYDETLNQEYPPESGFIDYDSAKYFLDMGNELAESLQNELGSNFIVVKAINKNIEELIKKQ